MEIDLNQSVCEVENNNNNNYPHVVSGKFEKMKGGACCFYGCLLSNSTNSSSSSSSSSSCSNAAASELSWSFPKSAQSSIYTELWHACAGPITSLPKKGNLVVYFPQGHLDQAGSASAPPFPTVDLPTFDLPPQIFCRVLDVHLLANKQNDEVYTQLSLLPIPELVGGKFEGKVSEIVQENENRVSPSKSTSQMFCKTLTVSDTSTHGGFSVPRRAAEDCFPPLNYKEQRPSQELIAKDLHGVEWKFRHIYRGQPRRHLLTTGWSIFVSQKNLVSGDAVLFLRGEGGELRLGIRRAARPRNGLPDSIIRNQTCYPNVLSPVADALTSNNMFPVFYSARTSHSDFIVPYQNYVKSTTSKISVGSRFKMRLNNDDSPERRFSGLVTGVGDVDPYRWRNSKWRCLMVRWDEDVMINHQERICPWDIDFMGDYAPLSIESLPRLKKLRPNHAVTPHGSPIAGGGALLDFDESMRSSKVLQCQENVCLVSPFYQNDMNRPLDFKIQSTAPYSSPSTMEKINYGGFVKNHAAHPSTFTGFLESNWFPKVLQGQEICSFKSLPGKNNLDLGPWSKPDNIAKACQGPTSCFYPLASEGARNITIPQNGMHGATVQDRLMLSGFSDFQGENHVQNPISLLSGANADIRRVPHPNREPRAPDKKSATATSIKCLKNTNDDENLKEKVPICKIFGFSLTKDHAAVNLQGSSKRSCTKVHKQCSLVGRAVDLSRLQGYDDLLIELERLFSMEGLLRDPNNGWCVLYTDRENDVMVVGDDPWREFVEVVTKIHIYTQEEVEKLTIGNSDDTKSCLEEAQPYAPDVSKSSSVGLPDSPSTIVRM